GTEQGEGRVESFTGTDEIGPNGRGDGGHEVSSEFNEQRCSRTGDETSSPKVSVNTSVLLKWPHGASLRAVTPCSAGGGHASARRQGGGRAAWPRRPGPHSHQCHRAGGRRRAPAGLQAFRSRAGHLRGVLRQLDRAAPPARPRRLACPRRRRRGGGRPEG